MHHTASNVQHLNCQRSGSVHRGGLMFPQNATLIFYFLSCLTHYTSKLLRWCFCPYPTIQLQLAPVTSSALSCPFLPNRGGMSLDWTCCWAIWFWFWLRKCWFWTCRESRGCSGSLLLNCDLRICGESLIWLIEFSPVSRITWLDLTKDFGPMSNCVCGGGAMWPPWPLKSGLVRWRPIVGEYLSWITPGPVPIPLPEKTKDDVSISFKQVAETWVLYKMSVTWNGHPTVIILYTTT